jgi:hypothetical protein
VPIAAIAAALGGLLFGDDMLGLHRATFLRAAFHPSPEGGGHARD